MTSQNEMMSNMIKGNEEWFFEYRKLKEENRQLRKILEFYAQGLSEEDEGIECGKYGSKARQLLKEIK